MGLFDQQHDVPKIKELREGNMKVGLFPTRQLDKFISMAKRIKEVAIRLY